MINIRFVKKQKNDDVEVVSLLDFGFEFDVPYSNREIEKNKYYNSYSRKSIGFPDFYGNEMEKRYLRYLLDSKSSEIAFSNF